jgi:head-tail adaptor
MMNPGELKTKVTIQQKVVTGKNKINEDVYSWVDFKTISMKAMIGNGNEFWAAQRVNAEISGILQGRYDSCQGITEKMRAVCKYGTFDIISPP